MKKAKNGRVKGNAITGITMAAIMLVFLVTTELMASAEPLPPESYSGLYNTITLGTNPPATSEPKSSIAIFVDTEAYSKLDYEVERLKNDIISDLDTEIFIFSKDWDDPGEIRDIILDKYNNDNLKGSILIGNIPYVTYGDTISDFYYMDLDADVDNCYKNEMVDRSCLGTYPKGGVYPYIEIWSGRIKPTKPGEEGIEQIRDYLNRNHEYRKGLISYDRKITLLSLIHIFDYKYSQEDYTQLFEDMLTSSLLYSIDEANIIYDTYPPTLKTEYINSFKNQNEFTFLAIHGRVTRQCFGESTYLYSSEVESLEPNSMIYHLSSCLNGDFTSADYMAGAYLFSGNALIVTANSGVSFITIDERTFKNIGQLRLGVPIGDVYRHHSSSLVNHLFGDPTLRLRPINLENSPKLKVDRLLIDFGEHPIGSETKVDYVIRNEGNSTLIIEKGGVGAKLNGEPVEGYIPFCYTFEGRVNKRIEIEPHSEDSIKVFFRLEEELVDEGVYEGYLFEMPTNDPFNPWITINLVGIAIIKGEPTVTPIPLTPTPITPSPTTTVAEIPPSEEKGVL